MTDFEDFFLRGVQCFSQLAREVSPRHAHTHAGLDGGTLLTRVFCCFPAPGLTLLAAKPQGTSAQGGTSPLEGGGPHSTSLRPTQPEKVEDRGVWRGEEVGGDTWSDAGGV